MTIVTTEESSRTDVVTIQMSGKLEREDYEKLVPLIEQRLQDHDKVRLLCEMTDFDGFTAGAAWEDIKFDVRHFNDVERIAVVGDTKWQERLTQLYKPFTAAEVRFFPKEKMDEAQQWIAQ